MSKVSISFYKRSFAAWVIITLVYYAVFSYFSGKKSLADYYHQIGSFNQEINVSQNGSITSGNVDLSKSLSPKKDFDLLTIKIMDEVGEPFSDSTVTVVFPPDIPLNEVSIKPYLIHSYEPETNYAIADNSIIFTTGPIDPSAIYSLKIEIPKGYLQFGFFKTAVSWLINQGGIFWIFIAILLPLAALIVFTSILFRRSQMLKAIQPNTEINYLPSNFPPALIGLLLRQKITNREITATLIDLAQRNIIEIFNKGENFSFIKRINFSVNESAPAPKFLKRFEFLILAKIFSDKTYKSTAGDINYRLGHRLFSDKIAKAYQDLYTHATMNGYFMQNPSEIHGKYRNFGLWFYVIGFIGIILSAITTPDPKFLVIFWIGMMVLGELIIKFSSSIPVLSQKGIEMLKQS
ncbi:MAG: Uncharacterized protein CEN91_574, partial [Candidatus Berkelbacteria bacterium Licking1014_85]